MCAFKYCVNPLNAVNPRNEMRTFSLQLLNFYQRGLWSKPYYELIPTFRVAGPSECLTTITDMTLKTLYSVIPRNKSTWSSIPEYRVNSKPPYPYWHDTMVPIIIWLGHEITHNRWLNKWVALHLVLSNTRSIANKFPGPALLCGLCQMDWVRSNAKYIFCQKSKE